MAKHFSPVLIEYSEFYYWKNTKSYSACSKKYTSNIQSTHSSKWVKVSKKLVWERNIVLRVSVLSVLSVFSVHLELSRERACSSVYWKKRKYCSILCREQNCFWFCRNIRAKYRIILYTNGRRVLRKNIYQQLLRYSSYSIEAVRVLINTQYCCFLSGLLNRQ